MQGRINIWHSARGSALGWQLQQKPSKDLFWSSPRFDRICSETRRRSFGFESFICPESKVSRNPRNVNPASSMCVLLVRQNKTWTWIKIKLYSLYYAEAVTSLLGPSRRHCACGNIAPLVTLCLIWPAQNLNLRHPTPETSALPPDQLAGFELE